MGIRFPDSPAIEALLMATYLFWGTHTDDTAQQSLDAGNSGKMSLIT